MWIASIVLAQLAGAIGSLFTVNSIESWYQTINKPKLNPPDFVFGPVWVILYTLMGIASYLVWQKRKKQKAAKVGLVLYGSQLVLNGLWSVIFFGMRDFLSALIEIIVLWILIILTMTWFKKVSKAAFWLLVPYLLWVSFAAYLNFSIYQLN